MEAREAHHRPDGEETDHQLHDGAVDGQGSTSVWPRGHNRDFNMQSSIWLAAHRGHQIIKKRRKRLVIIHNVTLIIIHSSGQ